MVLRKGVEGAGRVRAVVSGRVAQPVGLDVHPAAAERLPCLILCAATTTPTQVVVAVVGGDDIGGGGGSIVFECASGVAGFGSEP